MRTASPGRQRRTTTTSRAIAGATLIAGLLAGGGIAPGAARADDMSDAPEASPVPDAALQVAPGSEALADQTLADETLAPASAVDAIATMGQAMPADPGSPVTIDQTMPANTGSPAAMVPIPDPAVQRRLARQRLESRMRSAVVALARTKLGDRYIAGRAGPNSFDCSGLVRYVLGKVTGTWLPHYSRTQYSRLRHIPLKAAKPGDMVFYFRHGAHHVGIYIGNHRMVHAANPRRGVTLGSIGGPWYSRNYSGIGRLIPDA